MADVVDKTTRSRMMSGIRGKNTKPELLVRQGLHARGFRYRLHQRSLPGAPDVVLRRHSAVVFVHGCFWHGHRCRYFKIPATRTAFWREKIDRNRCNGTKNEVALLGGGWRVCTVWECALRTNPEASLELLSEWLLSHNNLCEIKG